MPGETYVYEFVAEQAGTYLYHCHVDSYRHIDMGMYGALVIDPVGEKTWDREYTLVLDEWDSHVEPLAPRYEPGPNHFLINGKAFPELPTLPLKVGETTRVRLINIGYNNFAMHLHGPHFEVVATDGHPLAAAVHERYARHRPGRALRYRDPADQSRDVPIPRPQHPVRAEQRRLSRRHPLDV